MEQLTIHQEYVVELATYKGFKIKLGEYSYETYLKQDYYEYVVSDVCFIKGEQKTLSATRKTTVTMVSYYTKDEVGSIGVNDLFYVLDLEENKYIAFGKVLEIIKQE